MMRLEKMQIVLRSLRFRLTAWNTAVVLLTVVGSLIGVREGLRLTLLRETDQLLDEDTLEVSLAVQEFHPNMEAIFHEMDRKAIGHEHRGLFVQLFDSAGVLLWSSRNTPDLERAPTRLGDRKLSVDSSYRVKQRQIRKAPLPAYTVRVGQSLTQVRDDISRLTNLMAVAGGAVLVLAPLGGYWLAVRATQPIAAIIHTTARLRPSHMEERLHTRGTGDELDQLSLTINRFLDQIADYLARNREFVANAAHELRSPLAAIQSSVEVALNLDRSMPEYKELLGEIVEECTRLGALVNQLLLLAETDARGIHGEREPVLLDRLVETSLDMFRGVAEERGVALESNEPPPIVVQGDPNRLRQVINNLVDNGLKFTPSGGRVLVQLSLDGERALLRVSDTGSGISPEDLPHVFERFYRGDKSRQRENPTCGNGLGLSICRAIVAAHEGEMRADSLPGRGAKFSVWLPVTKGARTAPSEGPSVALTS